MLPKSTALILLSTWTKILVHFVGWAPPTKTRWAVPTLRKLISGGLLPILTIIGCGGAAIEPLVPLQMVNQTLVVREVVDLLHRRRDVDASSAEREGEAVGVGVAGDPGSLRASVDV